jgi:hypothetical protein
VYNNDTFLYEWLGGDDAGSGPPGDYPYAHFVYNWEDLRRAYPDRACTAAVYGRSYDRCACGPSFIVGNACLLLPGVDAIAPVCQGCPHHNDCSYIGDANYTNIQKWQNYNKTAGRNKWGWVTQLHAYMPWRADGFARCWMWQHLGKSLRLHLCRKHCRWYPYDCATKMGYVCKVPVENLACPPGPPPSPVPPPPIQFCECHLAAMCAHVTRTHV